MKRLCIKYYAVNIDRDNVRVVMPGMIYDVQEFKDGNALVGGIQIPAEVFNPKEIKDLDK